MRCTPVSIPADAGVMLDSLDTGRVIIMPFDPDYDQSSQIAKLHLFRESGCPRRDTLHVG